MTKLPRGMSQLDYLWTNFGNYKVSEGIQSPPDPNSLITEKTLVDAIKSETGSYITNLKLLDAGDKLKLVGLSDSGEELTFVELDKENYLINAEVIRSTQEEIDNTVCDELDIPLLVLSLKNGSKYYVNLGQFNYIGGETNSIKTTVLGKKISAHLKIDNSIETPIVDVKITDSGLKVDLTIKDQSDKQLKLVRTDNGLDTSFTWDDGNNILFKCLTYDEYHSMSRHDLGKIYFITDEMCIYLNEVRYGDNLSLVDTDTIEITNIGNSVRLGVKIDPNEYNLLSKSSAGLTAQIYWEE
ncbi:hypothetical protein [Intestinibacter sp.]|uniref:hypothetical protein n=1 Tax=Intestinibacter sp. TaxID=1965304 RepID=UPI003F17A5B0